MVIGDRISSQYTVTLIRRANINSDGNNPSGTIRGRNISETLGSCDRASLANCEERENQQDATIRCLLSTSVSTCFGHHYAHLQEN